MKYNKKRRISALFTCYFNEAQIAASNKLYHKILFSRHANCDCLLVASGYNSRNGVVDNYVKQNLRNEADERKNKRQKHLERVIKKLENYDLTTAKFADVLKGKKEANLGRVTGNVAKKLGVRPNTSIYIKRNYALHMDNSGHFSGSGFGRNGHSDRRPLTAQQVSQIPTIIKTARSNEVSISENLKRGVRYTIVKNNGRSQLVVVEVIKNKKRIDIVTSYIISKAKYRKYVNEK